MNKFIRRCAIAGIVAPLLAGCVDHQAQLIAEKEARIAEETRQREEKRTELAQRIDAYLSEQKDIFETTIAYNRLFLAYDDYSDANEELKSILDEIQENEEYYPSYMRCSKSEFNTGNTLYIVDALSKRPNDVNIACYDAKNPETHQSDECILLRRKTELDAACWFNYAKYLPEKAKIKNSKEFVIASGVADQMQRRMKECDKMQNWTTSEKADCRQKSKQFAYDYVTGNAKHCRDAHSKEWKNMLKESIEKNDTLSSMLTQNVKEDTARRGLTTMEANLRNTIGVNMFQAMAFEGLKNEITEFGLVNLCLTDGWEKDAKASAKKSSTKSNSRIGKTVTLN